MSDFERIGGEPALRALVQDFVGRCYADVMIGFLFRRADRARIERFEYEHAAAHLGGPVAYTGRPIREAHAMHRIMGGQFARRRRILEETLVDHGVPEDVRLRWLAHQDDLRPLVTGDADSSTCIGTPPAPRRE